MPLFGRPRTGPWAELEKSRHLLEDVKRVNREVVGELAHENRRLRNALEWIVQNDPPKDECVKIAWEALRRGD